MLFGTDTPCFNSFAAYLRQLGFAAAVNREEIMEAMQMAGVELEEIMGFIIEKQGAVK